MNKRLVTIILSLAIAAVPAFADTVNFGELGADTTVDLNAASPPSGIPYVITGLGFYYDPQGGSEQVSVDSTGIFGNVALDSNGNPVGTLNGALTILFPYAVTGLSFTFTADGQPDVNGHPTINMVAGLFYSALDGPLTDIATSTGTGTFSYGAAFGGTTVDPFSKVDLFFGNGGDSTAFTVDSIVYAPEPASFLLLGINLLAFGGIMRFRRRS